MKRVSNRPGKIIFTTLLTCLVATLLVPANGLAGKIVDKIIASNTLTVGTTGHFPPFSFKSKEGNYEGFDMELADLMAKSMGVKLVIKRYDMENLLNAVKKGDVDMALAGITMTPQRNLKVMFIGPYTVTGQSILAKKSVVERIKTPADMSNPDFKLAVVAGSTGANVAKAIAPKAQIIETKNMTEAFNMILTNKADALMADQPFCVVAAFKNSSKEIGVSDPFTYEPLGIAMPEGDDLLANWVENFLLKLNAVGKLNEMKKFWFTDPSWMTSLPEDQLTSRPTI